MGESIKLWKWSTTLLPKRNFMIKRRQHDTFSDSELEFISKNGKLNSENEDSNTSSPKNNYISNNSSEDNSSPFNEIGRTYNSSSNESSDLNHKYSNNSNYYSSDNDTSDSCPRRKKTLKNFMIKQLKGNYKHKVKHTFKTSNYPSNHNYISNNPFRNPIFNELNNIRLEKTKNNISTNLFIKTWKQCLNKIKN